MHRIAIPFSPDADALLARLGLDSDSDEAADFCALLERAIPLTKPKAVLGVVRVEQAEESGLVRLGGVEFNSALLAKNIRELETVWPYLATCGREIYDFAMSQTDPFERYWVEEIAQQALTNVRAAMMDYVAEHLYAGKIAAMGPGSLPEWPIAEQIPLFRLMEDAAAYCGIGLTETLLMVPNKSVSGILFPNEHGYVNCRLCPKDRCPNRKAKYEPEMAL